MSKIAIMFPGQGSQYDGMGLEIINSSDKNFEIARDIYAKSKSILEEDTYDKISRAKSEFLDQTRYGQPGIFLYSLALYKIFSEKGVKVSGMFGLSLGEYTALCASGTINIDEAIYLVEKRGQIMAEGVKSKGGMIAVMKTEKEKIQAIIDSIKSEMQEEDNYSLEICNINSPGQIVVGGDFISLDFFESKAKENEIKRIVRLNVEGPFHTPILKEAAEIFEKELDNIDFINTDIEVYSNLNASLYKAEDDKVDILKRQMYSPVLFQACIENMIKESYDTFIEIGPGKALSTFVKKIDKKVNVFNIEKIGDIDGVISSISETF